MDENMELLTDEELVDLTRKGEKEAYGILWTRHSGAGMTYASSLTRSDPEDLVVEAYTKILRAIRSGKGPQEMFRPYLYAAIRNASITRHHKAHDTMPGLEEASWGTMSVEGEVLSELDTERINRVLAAMKPAQRKILWLSEVEEHSVAQVAEEMKISPTNVSTSKQRARLEFIKLWTQDHVRTDGVEPGSEHEYTLTHAGEYLAGNPRQRLEARVSAHLAECKECAEKLEDAKSVSNMFRSRLAPAVTGTATSVVLASDQAFGAGRNPSPMPRSLAKMFPQKGHFPPGAMAVILAAVLGLLGVVFWPAVPTADELGVRPSKSAAATPTPPNVSEPPPPSPSAAPTPTVKPPAEAPPAEAPPAVAPPAAPATEPATPARPASAPKASAEPKPAIAIKGVGGGPSQVCYPTASGTAKPGSTIEVSNGTLAPVAVRVDAQGKWVSPELDGFTPGRRMLTADGVAGEQTADSARVTVATPPQVAAHVGGGLFVLDIDYAVPGVPIEVSIDGKTVGAVTADSGGEARYEERYAAGADKEISLRYHPDGCQGPVFGMSTGL